MIDDIMKKAEDQMKEVVKGLLDSFSGVRTGRASALVLEHVELSYYGARSPITQLAGIKIPDAHLLVIEPWDKSILGDIEQAILASDLGLTPSNDGSVIRLPFPAPTEERRRELVKTCKTYAESARVAVRHARQEANNAFDRAVKNDNLPEDEGRRAQTEVQKLTDKFVAEIDAAFKKKEVEVMEV